MRKMQMRYYNPNDWDYDWDYDEDDEDWEDEIYND